MLTIKLDHFSKGPQSGEEIITWDAYYSTGLMQTLSFSKLLIIWIPVTNFYHQIGSSS